MVDAEASTPEFAVQFRCRKLLLKQGRIYNKNLLKIRQAHPVRNRGNRFFKQNGPPAPFFCFF